MACLQWPNINDFGNRVGLLGLYIGMPVRLMDKLTCAARGLVTEALGTVVGFQYHEDEFTGRGDDVEDPAHTSWRLGYVLLRYLPRAVLVRFDFLEEEVGLGKGVVAVVPRRGQKSFKLKVRDSDNTRCADVKVTRVQIPLAHAYVRSTNTMQGTSADDVDAFLTRGNHSEIEDWLFLYVIISRCRTMARLRTWDLPERRVFTQGPPPFLVKGLLPLEDRARKEMVECRARLEALFPWSVCATVKQSPASVGAVGASVAGSSTDAPVVPPLPAAPLGAPPSSGSGDAGASAPPAARLALSARQPVDEVFLDQPGLPAVAGFLRGSSGVCVYSASVPCPIAAHIVNEGSTCFISAVLQVLLRVAPLGDMLSTHPPCAQAAARSDCVLCCAREQVEYFRAPPNARTRRQTPLAALVRRGRCGARFAVPPSPGCAVDAYGMVPRAAVVQKTGKLKKGPQCCALDFLSSFLAVVGESWPGMEGVAQICDLFGCVTRTRYGCDREPCRHTRDESVLDRCVRLGVVGSAARTVALGELWGCAFRGTLDTGRPCTACQHLDGGASGGKTVRSQVFLDREPPVLVINLNRASRGEGKGAVALKARARVSYPQRLDFLRSGSYVCIGALYHVGPNADRGHWTAAASVGPVGERYYYFDDLQPKEVGPLTWDVLMTTVEGDVCGLVYARLTVRDALAEGSSPFGAGLVDVPGAGPDGGVAGRRKRPASAADVRASSTRTKRARR